MNKSSGQNETKKEKAKEKTLPEKLKGFFGLSQSSKSNQQNAQWTPKAADVSLSRETIAELKSENPLPVRIKAMNQLYQTVRTKTLEDNALLGLVNNIIDLTSSTNLEARHTTLTFYRYIIEGQFEKLATLRASFFDLIKDIVNTEDLNLRLDLLKALTQNGKSIVYFEDEMGPFLMEWAPTVFTTNRTQDMLSLLVNFIKYNAAYLDIHITSGIVQHTCNLIFKSKSKDDMKLCLDIMDALICYSSLPSDVLPYFVISLCITINIEKLSSNSWKVMKNFLGTSMGMSGIFTMCTLIQDRTIQADYSFLRGAVYIIGASLWGSKAQCVSSLRPLPTAILPSLHLALDCPNGFVAYEVVQCIQLLLSCEKHELQMNVWEQILSIMHKLMGHPEVVVPSNGTLSACVHNVLSKIESMSREKSFQGSEERLYQIIDQYSATRPETSVLRLLEFHARKIDPKEGDWIDQLNRMMEHYFKNENRTTIRVKVLDILSEILNDYRHMYEEKLIEMTILQFLSTIELEPDLNTRIKTVQLLIDVALNCNTFRCMDILDIIKKVMTQQLEQSRPITAKEIGSSPSICNEDDVADIKNSVTGLVKIFKHKLEFGYPKHAIHVYQIFIAYLEDYYQMNVEIEQTSVVRRIIFQFFFSLRVNSSGHLGFVETGGKLTFSSNLMCTAKNPSNRPCTSTSSPPVLSPVGAGGSSIVTCDICINPVFQLLIRGLKEEQDWNTVKLLLQELPALLRNKALVICARPSITQLCTTLTALVLNKSSGVPESFYHTPLRFSRTDFHSYIFPVLSTLAAYHSEMASHVHRILIKCLEQGLKSKCSRACIMGLSLCTLEMQEVMYKLLPEVLLSLSKISATVPLAVPMLEFLSTLIRLPELYMSFVEDQYMSIFAIALPYTNPFKFNHYTVALAHHVIAMWFLKCRLPFRRDFVSYIMNGLKTNVTTPLFDEKKSYPQANVAGIKAEGTQRQRSGSLNDPGQSDLLRPSSEVNNMNLHRELLETCHDLLSKYCFCTASTLPKRSYLTEFLMDRGNSMSWLMGHTMITITTSGPGNKAYRDALCEQCYRHCVPQDSEEILPEQSFPAASSHYTSQGDTKERKRHRSAIQPSTREPSWLDPISKDDLQMVQRNIPTERFIQRSEVHGQGDKARGPVPGAGSSTISGQSLQSSDSSKAGPVGSDLICSCWCPGWAEVLIRRPTGNTSWLMRIQNGLFYSNSTPDFPVPDIGNWFKPTVPAENVAQDGSPEDKAEEEEETTINSAESESSTSLSKELLSNPVDIVSPCRPDSHSPLRRTSSSPDMKGEWIPQHRQIQQQPPPCPAGNVSPVPPLSPPTNKSEPFVVKSSPSSPTSKLCGDFNDASVAPLMDRSQKETRSSIRGSPKKEGKQCKPIPEEHETMTRGSNRTRLKLDLTSVDNQPIKGTQRSTSPPQSAGPFLASAKSRPAPKSPFFKRGSASPPPSSPKGNVSSSQRDRGHTISVVSPSMQNRRSPIRSASFAARSMGTPQRDIYRVGLSPSFVFLQLYDMHLSSLSGEQPLNLPRNEYIDRAVINLDRIPPYETHKIGVIYIGPDQANNETLILSNRFGSIRYKEFLHGLGTFVRLKDVDDKFTYLGGLDIKGRDGEFACSWQDDIMQVIFHVATLMPNHETDLMCNNKKTHIGNDYVLIAYNCSGEDYNMTTVKGQFICVCIEILPGDHGSNVVTVKAKKELTEILSQTDPQLVSDERLPIYVRQLALHASLASVVSQGQKNCQDPYVTNWLERLRQLKRIRERVLQSMTKSRDEDSNPGDSPKQFEDFTSYV